MHTVHYGNINFSIFFWASAWLSIEDPAEWLWREHAAGPLRAAPSDWKGSVCAHVCLHKPASLSAETAEAPYPTLILQQDCVLAVSHCSLSHWSSWGISMGLGSPISPRGRPLTLCLEWAAGGTGVCPNHPDAAGLRAARSVRLHARWRRHRCLLLRHLPR